MKNFNIRTNIGSARYVVNIHDGVSTHKDGSPFYGIEIFRSKRKMNKFVTELKRSGYQEQ